MGSFSGCCSDEDDHGSILTRHFVLISFLSSQQPCNRHSDCSVEEEVELGECGSVVEGSGGEVTGNLTPAPTL